MQARKDNDKVALYDKNGFYKGNLRSQSIFKPEDEYDRHGNFLGQVQRKPEPIRDEQYDRHGNFECTVTTEVPTIKVYDKSGAYLGLAIVEDIRRVEETFDTHGNFTGSVLVTPAPQIRETFDTHGNFTGSEKEVMPGFKISNK